MKRPRSDSDPNYLGTREGFLTVYDQLEKEMVDEIKAHNMPEDTVEWVQKMIAHSVPGGKLNRGLTVVHAVSAIKGDKFTMDDAKQAAMVGWCIEWLQAFFLVADDIMDNSITRRGRPCWYRMPGVGMIAINDSFLLHSFVYRILLKHFKNTPFYVDLFDLFQDVTWKTEIGQLVDTITSPDTSKDDFTVPFDKYNEDRYKAIVRHKTAYYTFFLPLASAFILGGAGEHATTDEVKEIALLMGEYFQVQDDYLDCYADEKVLGKIGTDIQDAKCSWLVVQAMKLVTPEQKAILEEHYGKDNPKSIAAVKELYNDLKLADLFHKFEAESYKTLNAMIDKVTADGKLPKAVFTMAIEKIYKREK